MSWKFSDPPNAAVFTTWPIIRGDDWIGLVSRDAQDGDWQFLSIKGNDVSEIAIISLRQAIELDPTLIELADLPVGWRARRDSKGGTWRRDPNPGR
jgi:hypothetical protein